MLKPSLNTSKPVLVPYCLAVALVVLQVLLALVIKSVVQKKPSARNVLLKRRQRKKPLRNLLPRRARKPRLKNLRRNCALPQPSLMNC
jgi:hypothetical protein